MRHARFWTKALVAPIAAMGLAAAPAFGSTVTEIDKSVSEGDFSLTATAGPSDLVLDYSFVGGMSDPILNLGVNVGLPGDAVSWRASMEMWRPDQTPAEDHTTINGYHFTWDEAEPGSGNDPTWGPEDKIGKDVLPSGVSATVDATGDDLSTTWTIPLSLIGDAYDPTTIAAGDTLLIGGSFRASGPGGGTYQYPENFVFGDQETFAVATVVPSPAAAGAGLVLLGGLMLRRRRPHANAA